MQPEFRAGKMRAQFAGENLAGADARQHGVRLGARSDGWRKLVVRAQDQRAARLQRLGQHPLLPRDGLAAAHELEVRHADVRDDGHVRRGHRCERRDLAGVIHAHFKHAHLIAAPRPQERERDADVVVQIALGSRNLKMFAEHRRRQIFRARLAIATRQPDGLERQRAAVVRREFLQTGERVRDEDDGEVRRQIRGHFLHHRARRAAPRGLGDESVRVEILPTQRHKKITGFERARVRADDGNLVPWLTRDEPPFGPSGDFFKSGRVHFSPEVGRAWLPAPAGRQRRRRRARCSRRIPDRSHAPCPR